jgi:hypothetical protein
MVQSTKQEKIMTRLTCKSCGKQFEALNQNLPMKAALGGTEKPICYACALQSITGGRAPEEGDFNSARIISGEMSEKEWKWLQEDLRAVEESRSIREYDEDIEYIELCDECGGDRQYCYCDYDEEDGMSDE